VIIAAAQIQSRRGDIQANLREHYRWIERASQSGAELIVFPETSITGYERANAALLAFTIDDNRLDPLIDLAFARRITVVAGAPIKYGNDLFIGSFIIHPDRSLQIYTKQFLHSGEEIYYKPSFDFNPIISVGHYGVSFSICFDIENPIHPANASKNGSTFYVSSIFYTPSSIKAAHDLLSGYARQYAMPVLMSNFCVESWTMAAGGRSAFWDESGMLVGEMDDLSPGLLVVEKIGNTWRKKNHY